MSLYQDLVNISISEEKRGNLSDDRDLRFLYVYEGDARTSVGERELMLAADDFCSVNIGETAFFEMEKRGVTGVLTLRRDFVVEYLELRKNRVRCCSVDETIFFQKRVGSLLRSIFGNYIVGAESQEARLMSDIYMLLYVLRDRCLVRKTKQEKEDEQDARQRTRTILSYLEENYQRRITLSDLSAETYFSTAYLSKYFKKQFGRNFSEVLLDMRLKHAALELINTEISITQIALDSGFSSPVAFTKYFRKAYGMTPSLYRQSVQSSPDTTNASQNEKVNPRLKQIVTERSKNTDLANREIKELSASVSEARSFTRFWSKMINGASAVEMLRADMQEHILLLHRELGFEYVRFWDIYAPEMMLYDGNMKRKYSFRRLDSVIDFLIRNGMRPYIELGEKPKIMLRALFDYMVDGRQMSLFETPEQRGEFVRQLLLNYVNRYGLDEVEKWHFELWQDPRSSDAEKYAESYRTVQRYMKEVSPRLLLGGPGISSENTLSLDDILKEWETSGIVPDVITVYLYPYARPEKPSDSEDVHQWRMAEPDFADRYLTEVTRHLREKGFFHQKIHITEWNSTVANRNNINDSTWKGAYIVRNLLLMIGRVDMAGYWLASDLFSEYYDATSCLYGSGGLLSRDGIHKPAFWGISFFNRLEQYLLKYDNNSIITGNAHGSYSIVCHNFRQLEYPYFAIDESKVNMEDREQYFSLIKREFHFRISGVRNGTYQIKIRVVDENKGSVQDEWRNMGFVTNLNERDLEYLRRISVPHLRIQTIEVYDGTIDFRTVLEPNAIEHIHIFYQDN